LAQATLAQAQRGVVPLSSPPLMGARWAKQGAGAHSATPAACGAEPQTPRAPQACGAALPHKATARRSPHPRRRHDAPAALAPPMRRPPPRTGIMKRHGPAPQETPRPFWRRGFCPFRKRHRVVFRSTVSVTEFARLLDGGGTVPGDGTRVTLGLGSPVRRRTAPLAAPRGFRRRPIEETAYVPCRERVRMLRKSMGDARYFGAWARHRWEVARILRSRKESAGDEKDITAMPSSLTEARERALQLKAAAIALVATPLPPRPRSLWPKSKESKALKRKLKYVSPRLKSPKKVRRQNVRYLYDHLNTPIPIGRKVFFTTAEGGSPTKCHFCMRYIAEGKPSERCMCLAESAGKPSQP